MPAGGILIDGEIVSIRVASIGTKSQPQPTRAGTLCQQVRLLCGTGTGFSSIIPVVFAAGGRVRELGEATGIATASAAGYLVFLADPPLNRFMYELRCPGCGGLPVFSELACCVAGQRRRAPPVNPRMNPLGRVRQGRESCLQRR
jgi:hypothetical protein